MKVVRIGLVGFGAQMQKHHWPYLIRRIREQSDLEIKWISGFLAEDSEVVKRTAAGAVSKLAPETKWYSWLHEDKGTSSEVDAVIISLPNYLHAAAIRRALEARIHVAVDKPAAICSQDVSNLCQFAEQQDLLLIAIAQRRYEDLYQCAANLIRSDAMGWPFLIEYLIAHDDFGSSADPTASERWQMSKVKSGGGVLMGSAYHGIDIVLWLLGQSNPAAKPITVNASWIEDQIGPSEDKTEAICHAYVRFKPDCLFAITASRLSPAGSIDEMIKLFGPKGCIRIVRERTNGQDREAAATLTYQSIDGCIKDLSDRNWRAKRWAPVKEFIDLLLEKKFSGATSTALASLQTIRVIEKAYESAAMGGTVMNL